MKKEISTLGIYHLALLRKNVELFGEFVTLNPGVNVSENVTLGEGVEVGTGSILIPHTNVGEWSVVGAGSLMIKPLAANVTAVGSPVCVIKTRQPNWHLV